MVLLLHHGCEHHLPCLIKAGVQRHVQKVRSAYGVVIPITTLVKTQSYSMNFHTIKHNIKNTVQHRSDHFDLASTLSTVFNCRLWTTGFATASGVQDTAREA